MITESMSSNDDWLGPSWNISWDVAADDWLSEDGTTEVVSDCSIWRLPHLLEFEFFDSSLIWGNGGALDTNLVLFDGNGSINCNLVISGISVLHAQIEVLDINIKEWKDKLKYQGLTFHNGLRYLLSL